MKLRSPAKINRFLEVVGKRSDGYHEILTKMQAVNLFDELTIEQADKTSLTCNWSDIPLDHRNLVIQAHQVFEKKLGERFPVIIHLEKNIPHEAGLGGGSSNAATTLWGLNKLAKEPFSLEELSEMGALIGSDVPFFFSHGLALCSGRGELVQDLPVLPIESFTLEKPPFGLSTAKVYEACQPGESLETAAYRVSPELKEFKETLEKSGYSKVTLTGSGTAFFCEGDLKNQTIDTLYRKSGSWY